MQPSEEKNEFQEQINSKEKRKLHAQKQNKESVLQGFSVFGIIGWSVAIPTVLSIFIGLWLDKQYLGQRSFTLAFLTAGIFLGCLNAWFWVSKKMKEIDEDKKELTDD